MSKAFQLKALREKRGTIKAELEKLGAKLKAESRAMSEDEKTAFDKLKTDWVAVGDAIRTAEGDINALDELLASAGGEEKPAEEKPAENSAKNPGRESRDYNPNPRGGDGAELARNREDVRLARQAWARKQYRIPLTRAHVDACKRLKFDPRAKSLELRLGNPATRAERFTQQRALTVTTTAGGYLIPQDYSFELEQKLVDFSNVRGVCREVQTSDGAPLPWPTEDDTGNTGELLAINTEVAYADPTFASVTFGAFKFSSKGVLVPNELLQDSAFDVDSMIFGEIGTRIGRIQATHFTTGAGTTEPKGVVTCAAAGNTTALAAAFTGRELTLLAHEVDPAYRAAPGVGYMMKDDVVAYCLTLLDSTGRPLMRESFRDGTAQLMLNGYPVYVNQKMTGLTAAVPVTAQKHVLFGDFKKFIVRDAGSVRVMRLDERWAEKDQVGFIGFLRSDSNCVNTAAIKYMLQA